MFGYVIANKPELKIREFARYKSYYCGLCRRLRVENGRLSQITLTYDMTFLVILLSSLYEPKEYDEEHRCVVHPAKKQKIVYNEITNYAADMNVLMSYYHFEDDWQDEKKVSGLCGQKAFATKAKKIENKYPRQAKVIREQLKELTLLEEKNETHPDKISRPFGQLMSEIFVYREDAFGDILRRFGYFLGKYIYLLDAYMDLEKDMKKGCFNPFVTCYNEEDFDQNITNMLDSTIREAIVEFEKLPLDLDLPILRNILYEGVKVALSKRMQEKNKVESKGEK